MGVDYRAILYVGKEFEDQHDAQDFYERFVNLSEEDQEYIEDESFQEYCYNLENGLSGDVLDCYSGYGFVFGVDLGSSIRNPETFAQEVQKAIAKWKEIFGEEKYEIIHTVRVY